MKVGVIGLGSMGYGIATSLIEKKHSVYGADINTDAVKRLIASGAQARDLVATAAELEGLVVVVLNAQQTRDVLFGDNGVAAKLAPGSVVISCATVAPEFAREMASLSAEMGLLYLDAPISGGSVKAAQGKLTVMASGPDDAFKAAQPVLDAMAEIVFNLGPDAGAGSAMKAVNQMLAGIHIAAMAEALTFGLSQGISAADFLKVIPKCAGTSWMLENRAPHIVNGDYTPHSAVDIWPKDLGIVLDVARGSKFSAPLTATALQQFVAASGKGLGREDDAAVAKVYAQNAGLELPSGGQ